MEPTCNGVAIQFCPCNFCCLVTLVMSNSVWPCVTLWTISHQPPLPMGLLQARVLQWVALPSSRVSPNPGMEPRSPVLQADSLPLSHQGSPHIISSSTKYISLGHPWGPGVPTIYQGYIPGKRPAWALEIVEYSYHFSFSLFLGKSWICFVLFPFYFPCFASLNILACILYRLNLWVINIFTLLLNNSGTLEHFNFESPSPNYIILKLGFIA